MKHVTCYFDVISPYAYLAFERQVGLDPTEPPTAMERDAREVVVTGQLMPKDPCHDVRLAVLA